jgi:hypothetical protein
VFGKPADVAHATAMLRRLTGRRTGDLHRVVRQRRTRERAQRRRSPSQRCPNLRSPPMSPAASRSAGPAPTRSRGAPRHS